jgi:uncharacterized protein (TIGR03118 family)
MRTKSHRQAVPVRPTLECLEDRRLLSAAAAVTANDFLQVNLVANVAGVAANTDPNLIHPTGISDGPAGPFWVSDSGANVSTLYNTAGNPNALVVAIPGPNGSAPNVTTSPTGQINPAADGTVFLIPGTGPGHGVPAAFMFATADGTIAAWDPMLSPNTEAVTVVDNSGQGASFTGLASGTITTNGTANSFLYAADFRNGKIDVFDSSFQPVSSSSPSSPLAANAFQDSRIPAGFSPYNIQQLGGTLFVTYAKVGPDGSPVLGAGQGFVDAFSTTGKLLARFQGQGHLDAPFGLALVPTSGTGFAQSRFAGDVLVANTGTGTIAAFNPTDGHFDGLLNNAAGQPLTINGLRALQFGNGNGGGTAGVLYFTADPTRGPASGLFGSLTFVPETRGAERDTAILQTELAQNVGNPGTQANLLALLDVTQHMLNQDATNHVPLTQAQNDLQAALGNVLTANTAIIDQAILSFAHDKHLNDEFFQLVETAF